MQTSLLGGANDLLLTVRGCIKGIPMRPTTSCVRADHPQIGRREVLRVGGLSLFGTGLADLLRLEAQAANVEVKGRAKSVVFIYQSGGPSQHETFDPKPEAPEGIRGDYGVTQTRIPGVNFCEHLPKLAARADKFAIVRTMHHPAERQFRNEHHSTMFMLNTGTTSLPAGDTNASIAQPRMGRMEWPSIGSMIAYAAPADAGVGLPPVIEIPRTSLMKYAGRGPGLLGPNYERWSVDLAPLCQSPDKAGSCPNCFAHADPNHDPARAPGGPKAWWNHSTCRDPSFHLPDLASTGIPVVQIQNRMALLRQMDAARRHVDAADQVGVFSTWDAQRQRALQLMLATRPGAKNPFDLSQETDATRDLYGREMLGQSLLVARRLVEAGVRMVQVTMGGWDTHQNAFRDLKGKLLPSLDLCLSGFLDDLESRGLLDETLIVMCGEMGRTPKISPITVGGKNVTGEVFTPGRHHWGDAFPCFLAGGGIRGGQIVGQTDGHAGLPLSESYTPSDLAATIFNQLGIPPNAEFHDSSERPYRVYLGNPIDPLL